MDTTLWAEEVFGDAELGDTRRTFRLVQIASMIADKAEESMSSIMGSESENKAAYRFFGNDAFDYKDVISSVVDHTISQCANKDRVLFIQDTSHLNFDSKKATKGLGHIGSTQDRSFQGIMMHWTLAVDAEGQCLGLADLKLWERPKQSKKKQLNDHQNKPIESKESYKWIESVDHLDGRLPSDTQVIWLSDRESDIYDYMDTVAQKGQDFVVRANCDRVIADEEGLLKDRIRSAPIIGHQTLQVAGPHNKKKDIAVEIQCCEAGLLVQRRKGGAKTPRLCKDREISVVRVSSTDPTIKLEWILLTSLPVETLEECLEVIWLYKQRWHIESIHKTLKSGFRAEGLTLASSDRLEVALAVMLPCAIRVYWMAHLQKHAPEEPALKILSSIELTILLKRNKKPADYSATIKEAWLWIGWMGGFRGSKGSAPPGQITFWRGLTKLRDMAAGAELFASTLSN